MSYFRRSPRPRPQKKSALEVAGVAVEVTRKRMKYIRLKVSPPNGTVSVSAPHAATNREIEAMVQERLSWIHKQQAYFRAQPETPIAQFTQGEQHLLWGQKLPLELVTARGRSRVFKSSSSLMLINSHNKSQEQRADLLDTFYRQQLQQQLPALIKKWQVHTQREALFWGIKKMKTRWGSCNTVNSRIWLNLELVKYPVGCLEYVMVHELTHLYEGSHNQRFYNLLESFMPSWQQWEHILKTDGED